jgi:ADP-heptose:LPS heptosyltransferase
LGFKTTSFWPFYHFFLKKKKRKKKKENIKKKRGGGGKKSGVAPATPTAGLGVVEPPPWPRGWFGHPQKPKKKKKKRKEKWVLAFWGWPDLGL